MSADGARLSDNFAVVSGVPAGNSGTGQLVAYLRSSGLRFIEPGRRLDRADDRTVVHELVFWMREGPRWLIFFFRLWILRNSGRGVLLLHPQDIGFNATLRIIKLMRGNCWIYLLDSSFFCIRSYNFMPMETSACLRCLADPSQYAAKKFGCAPFPRQTFSAMTFVRKLRALARSGKVSFFAQNQRQATLAEQQFGVNVPVVGLWTAELERSLVLETTESSEPVRAETRWDVVFHGNDIPAKGSRWALSVAQHAPGLSFLFPFKRPEDFKNQPDNCDFVEMCWTSGLKEAVSDCEVALSPSAWSAPIEGALIKNIRYASVTAVLKNETSFSDEIPNTVVLHLENEPEKAAEQLVKAVSLKSTIEANPKVEWLEFFVEKNRAFIEKIKSEIRR
ncbi:MAG: hypothetical protein AAFX07_04985 [Pseudomonadota bacterium]